MKKELANVVFEMEKLNESDLKKLFDILCDKIGYECKGEKTLDDFTMEEVLEYAKAYKSAKAPVIRENGERRYKDPTIDFGAKKYRDVTYEEFKEFVFMKLDPKPCIRKDVNNVNSEKAAGRLYKYMKPIDEWVRYTYDTRLEYKLIKDTLVYFFRNTFVSKIKLSMQKLYNDYNLDYFVSVALDRDNIINPVYLDIPRHNYALVSNINPAEPFRQLVDMVTNYAKASLNEPGTKKVIHTIFESDYPNTYRQTTLEKIANIIGTEKVIYILTSMGFDNVTVETIKSKTFICNMFINFVSNGGTHDNIMISQSYAVALNELEQFNIRGFKMFDIYAMFMKCVGSVSSKLSAQKQREIVQIFIDTNMFGTFSSYSLLSDKSKMNAYEFGDFVPVINDVRKHNSQIPKNSNLVKPAKHLTVSKVKWIVNQSAYVVKNPQTVIYYILRLGITNKQIQKLADCSSLEVIAAAKNHNHWLNDVDNWKKGAIKELCLLCIKKGVSNGRLDQILCCGGTKIYQYYNQLIKEDPSIVSHLEIIK